MFQDITPSNVSGQNSFSRTFAAPFYESGSSTDFILNSTSFMINSVPHFFGDIPIEGSTNRTVIVYKIIDNENITVIKDAGTIDVDKVTVTLHSFTPDTTASIRITVTPDSLDIAPKRNQLLNIDPSKVLVTAQVDTITTSGSSGSIDYTTNTRLR